MWCPVEGLEFAEAEAGVEGGRPDRPFGEGERVEQCVCFGGGGDPVAAAADGRQRELEGGVEGDLAAVEGAAVDRS